MLPIREPGAIKTILKAYAPSLYTYRWLLALTLVFMVLSVMTKAVYPFLLRHLLEALQESPDVAGDRVWWSVAALVGSLLLHNLVWWGYDPCIAHFISLMKRDIDQRSFAVVQGQSMRFFENNYAGSLVTATRRFRNSFEGIAESAFFSLGRSATMIVITLILFAFQRTWLSVAFAIWVVLYCIASFFSARLRMPRDIIASKADSAVGGAFADSFSNQATVKSFGKEIDEQKRFNAISLSWFQKSLKAWMFSIFIMRMQQLIVISFEAAVILWLVQGWYNGTVTAIDFVFFQTYVIILIQQVWDVGNSLNRVFQRLGDAKEMADIFAQGPEVQDRKGARLLNVKKGAIAFQNVHFSYIDRETRERHDIHDFNLDIAAGQSVALVGHSGAGKSTLVKLLFRYFDLKEGAILIDGQDIAKVTQASLREQIALVPQQPELFHRSIRDNIAFARPNATEKEVIAAAKRAHAWEFIQRFPQGLETLVGERGVKLSGGERQRVALARAFLANDPILVLDEATSALDSKTEKYIQAAIADLLKNRTSIVIAHRLSTIQQADRIIVMENGAIVEDGKHEALIKKKGVYADLWAHQSGGYLSE